MKKLLIDGTTRKINKDKIVVGYLQENKIERLEFEIPDIYKDFGKKACFNSQGKAFAKTFDNITSNTLTLTRDMTQYNELEMSIAFFKTENEDEIVARTSILKIYIENAIICNDDIQPDNPKIVILDNLITKVTELNEQVTKNEKIRQNQEIARQQSETVREENEQVRVFNELGRKKAEEERKTNESERVSNENSRKEYINNLKTQVENGEFDGADFNYKWDGTKLGVKNSKETTYQFVELKGDKGDKGDTGNGIQNIEKISTVENVDTYAINYTNGTQTTFDVTNGEVTKEQLDEVDNRAKKTRNELERVKNDILETGTASDTFIHVEDSAWAELQELSVDGVLKQETTKGKQLYDYKDLNETYSFLTFDEDGWYTATCDNTSGSSGKYYNFTTNISNLLETNTTYSIVLEIKSITSTGNAGTVTACDRWGQFATAAASSSTVGTKVGTSTTKSDFTGIKQFLTSNIFAGANSKVTVTFRISVIKGTGITPQNFEYEPYTGGQPSPSPDYPQEIKTITDSLSVTSCNKNVFDTTKIASGTSSGISYSVDNNGIIILNGTTNGNSIEIPLNTNIGLNGTYTYIPEINDKTKINNIALKDASYSNVVLSPMPTTSNINGIVTKIVLYVSSEVVFNNVTLSIQILRGTQSNATSFEQHIQSQITANLPEGEFIGKIDDTYEDTLNVVYKDDGYYHLILNKMIGKKIFNGGPNEYWDSYILNDLQIFRCILSEIKSYNRKKVISNYFINAESEIITENGEINNNYHNYYNLEFSNQLCADLAAFKKWLATHNTEVYHILATPYEIDLGVVDMLLSYNEVTNIFTDSDLLPTINAKYYRNFTKTVQNLQVNEKALRQELIDINNRLTALETAKTGESEEISNDIQE